MQQSIEITLIGMNEIAREGLARILASDNFIVKSSIEEKNLIHSSNIDGRIEDIVIVDAGINSEGLERCRQIKREYPGYHVVLLADGFEYDEVAAAFRFGVDGYLVKEISCEPLFESLRLIALGEKVLPSQLAENLCSQRAAVLSDDWATNARAVLLSDREVEVLACLTLGMANKIISRRHNISEATVKVHVKAILRKLRVANRTQAAIWAVQHGLDAERRVNGEFSDLVEEDEEDIAAPAGPSLHPQSFLASSRYNAPVRPGNAVEFRMASVLPEEIMP